MADLNIHEESRILYLARALYDAVEDSNIQQVNILLSRNKANPNVIIPERGMATFHLAAGHENQTFGKIVCKLFLHNRGDPNILCEGNRTIFHIAVAWNRYIILETLLKSPYIVPVLFAKDDNGFNVFNYAIKYKAWESLAILQSAIKNSKSTSLNQPICNTIQNKKIVEDDSVITENVKAIKSIGNNSALNESDILHTNSGYFDSVESLKDTSVSIRDNLGKTNISDILNKNISSDNSSNALFKDISSFNGSTMNLIASNFELTNDNILFEPLNVLDLNDTKWVTNVSEITNCEEYFTCLETNSKQIVNNKMDNDDNLSEISVHELTRSISKMSVEISNLDIMDHYESSSVESNCNLTEISNDYDTDYIKYNLRNYGIYPGPIVNTTKQLYIRKLNRIKRNQSELNHDDDKHCDISLEYSYSIQLMEVLNNDQCDTWKKLLQNWSALEKDIIHNHNGSSFTYLLLDPRITKNLPGRVDVFNNSIEIWQTFINSIFYVGKGTNSRPYAHIREAFNCWYTKSDKNFNPKTKYILSLWKENMGVVCVQAFHNLTQKEANIREAAMIEAIGLNKLTNEKHGTFYDKSKRWGKEKRCKLGCYLLYRAMNVFLADGERQLQPKDLT